MSRLADDLAVLGFILWCLVVLAVNVAIVLVIIHFILKYW